MSLHLIPPFLRHLSSPLSLLCFFVLFYHPPQVVEGPRRSPCLVGRTGTRLRPHRRAVRREAARGVGGPQVLVEHAGARPRDPVAPTVPARGRCAAPRARSRAGDRPARTSRAGPGRLLVDVDPSPGAGGRGQAPRLEEAGRPQPLVDAQRARKVRKPPAYYRDGMPKSHTPAIHGHRGHPRHRRLPRQLPRSSSKTGLTSRRAPAGNPKGWKEQSWGRPELRPVLHRRGRAADPCT